MRNQKTNSRAHVAAMESERALRRQYEAELAGAFDRCAECGQVAGIMTGFIRMRDEVFVCADCTGDSDDGRLRASLKECESALSLLRHRGLGSIEGHEVDRRIGAARRVLYGKDGAA